jgi:hypothetical protein
MESGRFTPQLGIFLALAAIGVLARPGQAQTPGDAPLVLPLETTNPIRNAQSAPDLRLNLGSVVTDDPIPSFRLDRFQLFRMPAGFLTTPPGLDSDDDDPATDSSLTTTSPGDDRLQVLIGQDNPFFDFRYRGDPGGYGYYRLHAQCQLLNSNSSGLCLGLRAVTPAGLETDGLAEGRTVLNPALSWYQDLGANFIVHGYVGKNLRASPNWTDNLERSIHYGLAVQQPIPGLDSGPIGSLHMFVEALGRQRSSPDLVDRPTSTLQMLPGLHWQMGENWWMQGGILVPMGSSRLDAGLWQITCSWRF